MEKKEMKWKRGVAVAYLIAAAIFFYITAYLYMAKDTIGATLFIIAAISSGISSFVHYQQAKWSKR
jgi:hypothetical protein